MSDNYTEVTSQNIFQRLGGSIKGIITGFVLILAAIWLLWWNEGRAVQTAKSLAEGKGAVVEADTARVKPELNEKLVHLSGMLKTNDVVGDKTLGVMAPGAISMARTVQMYQWVEKSETKTEKDLGGTETTTTEYYYEKEWSSSLNNSDNFKRKGYVNPESIPYGDDAWTASNVTIGAYKLGSRLINMVGNSTDLTLTEENLKNLPLDLSRAVLASGTEIFVPKSGGTQQYPMVGDIKISYTISMPYDVSIIAQQMGNQLEPYKAEAGDDIVMMESGFRTSEQMFKQAEANNNNTTWLLRFLGYIVMAVGFFTIMKPLKVAGDVIPFVGSIIGYGLGLAAGIVAAPISLTVIALAWMFYRPILTIVLIIIGLAIFFVPKYLASKKAQATA